MSRVNVHKYLSRINEDGLLVFSQDGLERVDDRFKRWDINRSITAEYGEAVDKAIENEWDFQNFKNNPKYASIVGMCDDFQSRIWLERIEKEFPEILSKIEQFKKNNKDFIIATHSTTFYSETILHLNL